jgi:hypothetical protein
VRRTRVAPTEKLRERENEKERERERGGGTSIRVALKALAKKIVMRD